jgi:DNA-binding MarR family transcriptional regulator
LEELIKLFVATAENYNNFKNILEHQKRNFAGIDLFPSEIHTLVYIRNHINNNFTELSKGLGLTKGAFTSFVNKLLNKNLLLKSNRGENRKSIYFDITETGEQCCLEHKSYHDVMKIEIPDGALDFFRNNQSVLMKALGYTDQLLNELTEDVRKNA